MKSLGPRLLTAVIGIPLIIVVIFFSEQWHLLLNILLGVVTAIMTGEYLYAGKLIRQLPLSIPCILYSAVMALVVLTPYIYVATAVYVIMVFSVMLARHKQIRYQELAYALSGTLLITFGMTTVSYLCYTQLSLTFFLVAAFAIPWMADAGGFFFGVTLGKHKLCPNISPKKSVEGAVGGVIFCVAAAIGLGFLFKYAILPNAEINFVSLAILGVIDAPISIVGDLAFSLIKRSLKVKDYGTIFPGHGGFLDRFDSVIFTAPVLFAVNQLMPLVTM